MAVILATWQPWDWSSSAWSALTFVVLVGAAALTWRQVREAQRAREEQSRPFVLLDFEIVFAVFIELHVRNVGQTIARDIRFEFDKPLESAARTESWNPADLSMFREGIKYLAPGKTIKVLLDQFVQREEQGLPRTYTVTVTYTDSRRKNDYREDIALDLNTYVGTNGINQNGLHEIHKQLESIADNVKRWTDFHGLKIVTSADQERRAEEARERYAEIAAARAAEEAANGSSEAK